MAERETMGTRQWLPLPERKVWRATVINSYLAHTAPYAGVVCFTSGNAGRALEALLGSTHGPVVLIGPDQALEPAAWWSAERIRRVWPQFFDATPGHLSPWLMAALAEYMQEQLGTLDSQVLYEVPTGSGETYVALCMAYPAITFAARHDVHGSMLGTAYHPDAPLNALVDALSRRLHITGLVLPT